MNVKRVGCCSQCDTPVYEIHTRFGSGVLEGFPRQIGKPTDKAYRIDYQLSDGTTCSMTSCNECVETMTSADNFPALWEKVLLSFQFEMRDDVRLTIGASSYSDLQRERANQFLQQQSNNYLLGVLSKQKLEDLDA